MSLTKEQNKLFEENQNLVYATVHRRFSDPRFHQAHGLEKEDLFQYGLIGLYKACKDFNTSKGARFSSYAINRIVWKIQDEARKDSLNNINNQSFDLSDEVSTEVKLYETDFGEVTLLDILECKRNDIREAEVESIIEHLDKTVGKGITDMVKLRLKGYTYKEVGEELGMTHQGVRQRLMSNKDKIVECLL